MTLAADRLISEAEVAVKIGRAIRRRRQLVGLTQRQLGASCGVSFQQIQKYETAATTLAAARLCTIAHALSVKVSDLYPCEVR